MKRPASERVKRGGRGSARGAKGAEEKGRSARNVRKRPQAVKPATLCGRMLVFPGAVAAIGRVPRQVLRHTATKSANRAQNAGLTPDWCPFDGVRPLRPPPAPVSPPSVTPYLGNPLPALPYEVRRSSNKGRLAPSVSRTSA